MIIRVFYPPNKDKVKMRYENENRKLHREDGPARIYYDGSEEWWENEVPHRVDGPAFVWIYETGITRRWIINGVAHREDGPAIEYSDGEKHWYINGVEHRVDGPAIITDDGREFWYYNGKKINAKNQKEFSVMIKLLAFC